MATADAVKGDHVLESSPTNRKLVIRWTDSDRNCELLLSTVPMFADTAGIHVPTQREREEKEGRHRKGRGGKKKFQSFSEARALSFLSKSFIWGLFVMGEGGVTLVMKIEKAI